jgi:hypothetical protein
MKTSALGRRASATAAPLTARNIAAKRRKRGQEFRAIYEPTKRVHGQGCRTLQARKFAACDLVAASLGETFKNMVLGEAHLRRILKSYARYYNETRTHLALDKDAPLSRTVKRAGRILCRPILGGLHHEYVRI